jgi:hypothetical protein
MKFGSLLRFALLFALAPAAFAGPTEDIIAKARAFVGKESALDGLRAIRFKGTLEIDAKTRLPVDIIFQKDNQHRITVTSEKIAESTALDGYDAWKKRADAANPGRWQITLLDPMTIKRLRANTWQNLHYYRGIEKLGGRIENGGDVDVDGRKCVKLTFYHADNIWFARFFDKATGQLVKTITDNGSEIREEGEIITGGIRFPAKIINKDTKGNITTVTFDKATVNEPVPASEFAVPALKPGT